MKNNFLALLSLTFIFVNCSAVFGDEVLRIPVNKISTNEDSLIIGEASIELKEGDAIFIWSDMDLEYEGDIDLLFVFEGIQDTTSQGIFEIDPLNKDATMNEIRTTFQGRTSWKFQGRNGKFKIKEDAIYTYRVVLYASENPTLVLNKAEIVLRM